MKSIVGARLRYSFFFLLCLFISSTAHSATITSNSVTGNWSTPGSWVGGTVPGVGDDVIIVSGAIITKTGGNLSINSLTISSGGILTDNGSGTITVSGHLVLDGTWAGSSAIILNGASTNISGVGTISNTSTLTITNNKNILAGSTLIKGSGNVTLSASTTVTNFGSITIGGVLNGSGSGVTVSVWVNDINSILNYGGAGNLFATGTLTATALGNTVNYYGSSAQNVKRTGLTSFTYYNLTISGSASAVKTLANSIIVENDLTISSVLDASSRTLTLKGDWINSGGTFTASTSTVIFQGSGQTITSTSGEVFNNLTFNTTNSTDLITADNNIVVGGLLNMTKGNFDIGTDTLSLGVSTSSIGNFSYTSGTIIGKFERWIQSESSPGASVLFPVGTSNSYNPLTVTWGTLTTPGSIITEFHTTAPGTNGLPVDDADMNTIHNPFRDGFWSLTPANGLVSNDYDLTLTFQSVTAFTDPEYNGIDNFTRLLTRSNTNAPWTLEGNHASWVSGNTIHRTELSTLGAQYCFGDDTDCSSPITLSITGNSAICNGSNNEIYSVTNTSGSTYAWSISGGYSGFSGDGTNSISVNWSATGGSRTISVVEDNGCTLGADATYTVNVLPLAPGVITGKSDAPTNSSAILPSELYSVPYVAGYSYDWSVTGNVVTWSGDGSDEIIVQWGASGVGQISVTASYLGCTGISDPSSLDVEIYSVIYSDKTTGNWGTQNSWSCNCTPGASDNVVIKNGHTITASGNSVKHLSIVSGGILNVSSNNTLTVNGDLNLYGSIGGGGATSILDLSSGSGVTSPIIDGTGSFSTVAVTISATRSINSTALLTKTSATGAFTVSSGVSVINYGSITLAGSLTAGSSTSTWTNESNSTLSVGSALFSSPSGVLNASAYGNTVKYSGTAANVSIKSPASSQYANLTIANSGGNRNAPVGILYVSGDFTDNRTGTGNFVPNGGTIVFNGISTMPGSPVDITNFNNVVVAGTLTSSSATINIGGNFTNNGTFDHNNGTVNFNGTSIVSGNTTSFNNVSVSSLSTLSMPSTNVAGSFTNNGTFNHTTGTITFNSTTGNPAISGNTTQFINLDFTGTSLTFPSTEIDISGNINFGTGAFAHTAGGLLKLNGAADQTLSTNGATFQNVTVDKISGMVILGADNNMTISAALNLNSGDMSINGNTLTLNGTIARTGSYGLIGSAASSLFVGGTGAFGSLYFNNSGGILHTLNLDRASGTFDLVGPLTVVTDLNLLHGSLSNPASYLTMGNAATITRTANGLLTGSAPVTGSAPNGNNYNLAYSGSGDITTGLEAEGAHIKNVAIGLSGATLTQNSPLNLYGVLSVNSGTYDPGNERLLIRSWSDTENGSIGTILGTFMSGSTKKITVERYMSKKGNFNRYVSSPVTGTTLMDLADKFALVRNLAQYYDEVIPGVKDTKGYKTAALGTTLTSGKGYLVFPTPIFAAKDSIKWDVTGPMELNSNQGSVALPVTYTPSSAGNVHDGWNLVGNPYPSAIVWNNTDWSKTGDIDALIYVPDIAGGVFHVYDAADGDGIIAMGQAFWVKANSTSTLTVHESAKSVANGTFYRKAGSPNNGLTVSLSKDDITDKSEIRMQSGSTLSYERNKDYFKMEGELMAIGIASPEGYNLVRSVIETLGDDDIYLSVKTTVEGHYSISFTQQGSWSEYDDLYLVDKETGNVQRISAGAYIFKNKTNTTYSERFVLTRNPEQALNNDLLMSVFPNPTVDKITIHVVSDVSAPVMITNMAGIKLLDQKLEGTGEVKSAQFDMSNLQEGIYLIKTHVNGKMIVKKVIKL